MAKTSMINRELKAAEDRQEVCGQESGPEGNNF